MKTINWKKAHEIYEQKIKEAENIYEQSHDLTGEFVGISRTKFADDGKKVKPGDRYQIEPEGEIEFNESVEKPGTFLATLHNVPMLEEQFVQVRDKKGKILIQGRVISGGLAGRINTLDDIDPSFFTVLKTEK